MAIDTAQQQWINPYGQGIASLATQQLGKPIDVGAMTAKIAGPGAFTQAQQQVTADMGGLGSIQRDATGQVTGFTGGTGVASFQPFFDNPTSRAARPIERAAQLGRLWRVEL